MAEVIVGFVSAGVGIAAFALQISKSIDALRQMRLKPGEVRKDLTTLLEMLKILHQAVSLLKAWEGYQPVDGIIQHVQQRYAKIEPTIRDLLEKYQETGEGRGRQWKRVLARHPKQQIRDLREDINEIINILNLAFMAAQCQPPSIQELTPTGNRNADPSKAQEGELHQVKDEGDAGEMKTCTNTVTNPPSSKSHQEHRVTLPTARTSSNTSGTRRYDCSCNLTGITGRFWFLQYTPLSMFIGRPGERVSGCDCIGLRLRLALSKYGVPIAIIAGIGFMVDGSGLELRSSLRVERIVNYTSPGFETIWRLENGLISLQEARTRFTELYRSDSSLKHHKNPAGNSYIKTLLQGPWIGRIDDQISMLRMLVTDCKVTLEDETESFLVQCAEWSSYGSHLALLVLDAVLESGFDASAIHASPSERWPTPSLPIWRAYGTVPDPFFIEFVGKILRYSPSYSGSTNLHHVLLNEPFESAASLLHRSQPLETNVNFLGQTPLHIATTRPELCRLVLDAGHGIDVTDKLGTTPLMYAAAMGQTEVTMLLISRGANPALRDSRLQASFLDYALFCDHWDLALDALLAIQPNFEPGVFQVTVQEVLINAFPISRFVSKRQLSFLPKLIQLSNDVNFTFDDGNVKDNTLMHYAYNLENASALVQCGFSSFNQKNSEGKLAINSLAKDPNVAVIQFCLERGTDAKNVSQHGRTIFFELLAGLDEIKWVTWDIIGSIKLCLSAGADPLIADNCVCPCSPDGCHISSIFELGSSSSCLLDPRPERIWIFELLPLLEEYRGIEAAERFLLSLHRRVQCDKPHISIAHVCCHSGRGIKCEVWEPWDPPHLQDGDIEEILDEESDFITALDMDMERLACFGFSKLRTEFMIQLKGLYEAEEYEADSELNDEAYEVDYRADRYNGGSAPGLWPTCSIAQSMAGYAFWLQHERSRTENSLSRDFHKTGWFERRISWFLELMAVMEVTVEMLEESMGSILITQTPTEKIDSSKTVRSFLEAIGEARNKDQERETG